MGAWSRLRDWLGLSEPVLAAAVGASVTFSAPIKPIDQMFAEMRGRMPRIGRAEALTVPTVLRGRNLLCSVATFPLQQLDVENRVVRNPLLEQIDPDVPNVVTLAQTIEDLVFEGVSWWKVTAFSEGYPYYARHLDYSSVRLQPPGGRSPAPLPAGEDPRQADVYVDGVKVDPGLLIGFHSPNPAVLKVGGRYIRRALLLDAAAAMYAEDPLAAEYFSPNPQFGEMTDEEIEQFLTDWRAARKRRKTAYVPASMTYNKADSPSPAELQLVELQRQVTLDIANALGIDPEDLGVSTTSRTYQNDIDRRRDRLNDTLRGYMRAITDRLSMGDVTRRGYRVVHDLTEYLQSNPTEWWSTHKTAKDMGVLTVEEIRRKAGEPPLPPGAAQPAEPAPADQTSVGAANLRVVHFESGSQHFTADLPVQEFSVDAGARTIEGTVLPYGKIGTKGGLRFRIDRGALQYGAPNRIKLLRDHDPKQLLGVATDIKDGPAGVRVKFRIARGPAGDEALALAEDGALDGFSIGIDLDAAADAVPDPRHRGVLLVKRADWRETSLTAMPAFDDARVTKVAASRTGGTMDECATCGQRHAPGEACPTTPPAQTPAATPPAAITVSQEQFSALMATEDGRQALALLWGSPPAANGQAAGQPAGQGPDGDTGRQVVKPVRLTAGVTEPAPYRFDARGNLVKGSHDFSQDLYAASTGDTAARDRATEFVRAQFDIATGDVNELNPTRNRPDMYVDQRDFRYPLWDAISKGTLGDITPFTFPKFSSAAGLVGNHTEGVEPSSGTYVTTSQTVTPTAVSGKAKITRETWDQGGNPQVSGLIWRQMQKAWYEALEAAAVAVLDAASPTQIDFSGTPGLADEQLDQALTQAFAALQFIRGGFSMDNMFSQIDLYKALVGATDSTGRRIYPALGPTNATGSVRARWAALDINGVTALPAWALAASGTVAASSYLFDSASVHGWASAPQRLDFNIEVAHVYIGLWGYKATAISDINGVREIVYDPA